MKNSIYKLFNRLDAADRLAKIIQTEKNKRKKKQSAQDLWDNIK